jgi:polar amino acid transport system permease protein
MSNEIGRPSESDSGAAPYNFGGEWKPSQLEIDRRAARKERNRRNAAIAIISSVFVIGGLALVAVTSPGWKSLSDTFFAWAYGVEVLPKIILGFGTNVALTLIASVCVGIFGLSIALIRTSRSPALAPFRILATVYVDVFRGIPMLLVLLLVGFENPPILIKAKKKNFFKLATIAL